MHHRPFEACARWSALLAFLATPLACTDVDAGAPPDGPGQAARESGFVRPKQAERSANAAPTAPASPSTELSGEGAVAPAATSATAATQSPDAVPTANPVIESAPSADSLAHGPAAGLDAEALARSVLHASYAQLSGEIGRAGAAPSWSEQVALTFVAALRGSREAALESLKGLEKAKSKESEDLELVRAAIEGKTASSGAIGLRAASQPALRTAMQLALLERDAFALLESAQFGPAARGFSSLLMTALDLGWAEDRADLARWSHALGQAQAQHRWNPHGEWPAIEVEVQAGDHLIGIRKRVLAQHTDLLLSTGLIARANRLRNENSLRLGEKLRIPTDRASARVDVSARWVLFLLGDEVACAWEVGVGKQAGSTRVGEYTIGDKREEPMWFAQGRDPVPFGDPENPLGTRWMAWYQDGKPTSLGFHGTNDEKGIGFMVSEGCIRMRNAEVEDLFEILPKDAKVMVHP